MRWGRGGLPVLRLLTGASLGDYELLRRMDPRMSRPAACLRRLLLLWKRHR